MALHDRVINDPGVPLERELFGLARFAESQNVLLFRLLTDHYPAFLPFYYFFEEAL